jgi:origin recognition complex subunit 3
VLFFGTATSIDNLQERLSQSAIRYLDGRQFDVVQADVILEDVFFATTGSKNSPLRLGAQLSHMLLERHKEHLQSVQDFAVALQYASMAHFYANPLSVFLLDSLQPEDISKEHFEALRNVPSFRTFAEDCLTTPSRLSLLRELLDSDEALFKFVVETVSETQDSLGNIDCAVSVLSKCQAQISKITAPSRSELFLKALAGQLAEAPAVRELLLGIQRTPSDLLQNILPTISPHLSGSDTKTVNGIKTKLDKLLSKDGGSKVPLRSEHDIRNDSLRTTVVAQKVQLSRHKSHLSENDAAYSNLVSEFHGWLKTYFQETLVDPESLPLHEIVLYESRVPHRAAFTPKTRFSVERALFAPHDYLNCSCCAAAGDEREGEVGISCCLAA